MLINFNTSYSRLSIQILCPALPPRGSTNRSVQMCNWGLTAMRTNFTLNSGFKDMAENIPNTPGGAMPPKPAEAAKVQPKKETVRINLPPKPTSAPTIKLPTLAPGAPPPPSAAVSAAAPVAVAVASAPAASKAPPPPTPPATGAAASRVAAPAVQPKAAPTVAPRPAYAAVGLTGLDKGLAIAAAVIAVASAGIVAYLVFFLKDTGS
jgi:hypothetical protein